MMSILSELITPHWISALIALILRIGVIALGLLSMIKVPIPHPAPFIHIRPVGVLVMIEMLLPDGLLVITLVAPLIPLVLILLKILLFTKQLIVLW